LLPFSLVFFFGWDYNSSLSGSNKKEKKNSLAIARMQHIKAFNLFIQECNKFWYEGEKTIMETTLERKLKAAK